MAEMNAANAEKEELQRVEMWKMKRASDERGPGRGLQPA